MEIRKKVNTCLIAVFIGFPDGSAKCWGTGKNVPHPRPELGREVARRNGIAATRAGALSGVARFGPATGLRLDAARFSDQDSLA